MTEFTKKEGSLLLDLIQTEMDITDLTLSVDKRQGAHAQYIEFLVDKINLLITIKAKLHEFGDE